MTWNPVCLIPCYYPYDQNEYINIMGFMNAVIITNAVDIIPTHLVGIIPTVVTKSNMHDKTSISEIVLLLNNELVNF